MIQVVFEGSVPEGKGAEVRAMLESFVAETRSHDGVESYEFYLSEDGTRLVGVERYRDAAALGAHMQAIGDDRLGAMMASFSAPPRLLALGVIPPEMQAAFAAMGVALAVPLAGFSR